MLLKGIYYANAGVIQFQSGDMVILNRIVDALVFKVNDIHDQGRIGLVSLEQKPIILEC